MQNTLALVVVLVIAALPCPAAELTDPAPLRPASDGAAWARTKGPYYGLTRSFALAPGSADLLYAVSGRDLYVTGDGGEHWELIETTLESEFRSHLGSVAVDPRDAETLYLACGTVMRSEDAGRTWKRYGPVAVQRTAIALAVHPTEPGVLYVYHDREGIMRYDGRTVTLLRRMGQHVYQPRLRVDRHNPDLIACKPGEAGTFLSIDAGRTWHESKPLDGESQALCYAGSASDKQLVWALAPTGDIYVSHNVGQSWERAPSPWMHPELWPKASRREVFESFPVVPGGVKKWARCDLWSVQVDGRNLSRVYARVPGQDLCRSDDGGAHWRRINNGLGTALVCGVQPLPGRPGCVVVATDSGLMRTEDGGQNWQTTLAARWDFLLRDSLAAHPTRRDLVFAMGQRGNTRRDSGGSHRHSVIFRSADGGATWAEVFDGEDQGFDSQAYCFSFDDHDEDAIVLYTERGVLKSADAGQSWRVVASFDGPTKSWRGGMVVGNEEAVTVAQYQGKSLWQTRDLGKTWREIKVPLHGAGIEPLIGRPGKPGALYALDAHNHDPEIAVLWVSEDFGDTWQQRRLPPALARAGMMARNPADPDMLLVGFWDGTIWISRDDGWHWAETGAGLPDYFVIAPAFSPADNRLYAWIWGHSLFWVELPAPE